MPDYEFYSQIQLGSKLSEFDQDIVKNEPMFFNSSWAYCMRNGGPITQAFCNALFKSENIEHLKDLVIDTRVHMLMQGWYPCIPGFHHDDVPRSGPKGQPNYDTPEYRSNHVCALINGNICPTEFAIGKFYMNRVPDSEIIYKRWHKDVERAIKLGDVKSVLAPSNQLIYFNDRTFHQGTRANRGGWRWFGRASWNTDRKPTDEIRRQVQVYLEHPMEGW